MTLTGRFKSDHIDSACNIYIWTMQALSQIPILYQPIMDKVNKCKY